MWDEIFKYFLPFVMPFVVGVWKKFISQMPSWIYPILSGFLGAIIMLIQALIREITPETTTLLNGMLAGLAGSGLYDIKKKLEK